MDELKSPEKKNSKSKKNPPSKKANIEKRNILEQRKRIKPGNCLKYVTVLIDPGVLSAPGSQLLQTLLDLGVQYEIRTQKHPGTILWQRTELQTLCSSESGTLELTEKNIIENEVVLLMHGEDVVTSIKSLHEQLAKIKNDMGQKNLTLIIYGLKNYCKQNPNAVRRVEIETALTKLQVFLNCSHRLHETAEEFAATVYQFSKAIAEIPYKKQEAEKYGDLNLFLLNDNKDCVRVEGTAGLSRLWQQHLTRLPLVTLETTEAIINEYPMPKKLIEAYENTEEGDMLLADLKIRRAGGPLSTVRRVGPELSRKIYTLYNSMDPNEKL